MRARVSPALARLAPGRLMSIVVIQSGTDVTANVTQFR